MCQRVWGDYDHHTCIINPSDHANIKEQRTGSFKFRNGALQVVHVCHCGSSLDESVGGLFHWLESRSLEDVKNEYEFYKTLNLSIT